MANTRGPKLFLIELPETGAELPFDLPLTEEQYRHIVDVLRLPVGHHLIVADKSSGQEFRAVLSDVRKQSATLRIIQKNEKNLGTPSKVHSLVCALCKGPASDVICEKATELGVLNILFFQAERSVSRLANPGDVQKKLSRFERKSLAASQQSGRSQPPRIEVFLSLAELLEDQEESLGSLHKLVCMLGAESRSFDSVSSELPTALVVGPEGDFTENEIRLLKEKAFLPVSLGPYTLRAETAAIAAISRLQIP